MNEEMQGMAAMGVPQGQEGLAGMQVTQNDRPMRM